MKTARFALLATLLLAFPPVLHAADGDDYAKPAASAHADAAKASITIVSPKDGAVLDAGESYGLEYVVVPGPGGDHFHVWVDGERGPGVHTAKGTYPLPKLAAGEHTITIKVVDKGHVPTGPEQTIQVKVK